MIETCVSMPSHDHRMVLPKRRAGLPVLRLGRRPPAAGYRRRAGEAAQDGAPEDRVADLAIRREPDASGWVGTVSPMATAIRVDWYQEGKLAVYHLPDGTELRRSRGNPNAVFELVRDHYRGLGVDDATITFRQVRPPRR